MAISDRLVDIYAHLNENPVVLQYMSLNNLVHFIVYAYRLKKDILLTQSATHDPSCAPEYLPDGVQQFLSKVIGASTEIVRSCWKIFKHMIWETDTGERLMRHSEQDFEEFGRPFGLSELLARVYSECSQSAAIKSIPYILSSEYAVYQP